MPSLRKSAGGEGLEPRGQTGALEKLQLPGVPFLRLVIFVPFFQQPVQMSGVHTGCLWAGNRTETGNQGLLWCCWWNWVLTEFDLQEKLGHTPSSALMLCSPTVGTCLERHILICFKNYF